MFPVIFMHLKKQTQHKFQMHQVIQ